MTELTDREAVQPEDYNDRVAANCKLAANADIEATWTDSTTGKKLYNQAALDAAVLQGHITALKEVWADDGLYGAIAMYGDANPKGGKLKTVSDRLAELEAMQGKGGDKK